MNLVNKLIEEFITLGKLAEVIGAELPPSLNKYAKYGRVLTQHVYVQPDDVVISASLMARIWIEISIMFARMKLLTF